MAHHSAHGARAQSDSGTLNTTTMTDGSRNLPLFFGDSELNGDGANVSTGGGVSTPHTRSASAEPPLTRRKIDHLPALGDVTKPPPNLTENMAAAEQQLYVSHWSAIKSYSHISKVQSVFNLRLNESSIPDLAPKLQAVFDSQKNAFKLNSSLGFVLRHNDTAELRYYHSSINNNRLFDEQTLVDSPSDFHNFVEKLEETDFLEHARQARPNSEWVVHFVTNLSLYINHLPGPLRGGPTKRRQGVVSPNSKHNQCFFHALALHKNQNVLRDYLNRDGKKRTHKLCTQRLAQSLYEKFTSTHKNDFNGIYMFQLPHLEELYDVGIQIYTLEQRVNKSVAVLVRRANPVYNEKMMLDLTGSYLYC